jgi:hypothetical protein
LFNTFESIPGGETWTRMIWPQLLLRWRFPANSRLKEKPGRNYHAIEDADLGRRFVMAGFKFFTGLGGGILFSRREMCFWKIVLVRQAPPLT